MQLDQARSAKREVSLLLNIGVQLRKPRRRIAVGIAPAAEPGQYRIALRPQSQEELDKALEKGGERELRQATGSELDIQITGPIRVTAPVRQAPRLRPLAIGCSVGHYLSTAGTLGFFAQRDGAIGFVSNNHVIAAVNRGKEGDDVVQPGVSDAGVRPEDVVASLIGGYPRLNKAHRPLVDCAFARLRDGVPYDARTIGPGIVLQPEIGAPLSSPEVLKRGRTTGLTRGRISAIDLDNVDVGYGDPVGTVIFNRQIEIMSIGDEPFSEPGDSGSLVVDPDGHPVGLLAVGTFDCKRSYANPIDAVLSTLGVTILT